MQSIFFFAARVGLILAIMATFNLWGAEMWRLIILAAIMTATEAMGTYTKI